MSHSTLPRDHGRSRRPRLTPRKRLAYLATTIVLPWLVVLGCELALRAGGYGSDLSLFTRLPDHEDFLVANQEVGKRYFGNSSFVPTPQLDFFRASKRQRTFRIVFQGESSAIGFPYLHGGAPSRMLEQRLQAAFADRDIEVINTALTAVNSYTLLDFAEEIVAQHPDAVMIYAGHNEYYGAFGAASSRGIGKSRNIVRAIFTLRRLRIIQLLSNLVSRGARPAQSVNSADAPRSVMEMMAGEQRVPLKSMRYEAGLEQFRANLRELLSLYRSRGIPVFIGTVASNERDQRPFVGAAAESLFILAKTKDSEGDYARAAQLYRDAKEHDELRFRAPEAINAIIREEAVRNSAHVVETQRALQRAAPNGIIGHTVMLEHLHPNIEGYFLIASTFFDALRQQGLIGDWGSAPTIAQARAAVPMTAVDSVAGLLHADRLTAGWPFQPKGHERIPLVDTLHARTTIDELAQALVLGRTSWPEAMERLRASYERAGDLDSAIRVALAMAQEYKYSAQPYVEAARIEVARKRYEVALRYLLAATARQETAKTVQLAGLLLLRQGNNAEAVRYLERSVQLAPNDQQMAVPLRSAKALPALEQRLAEAPRDTTILYTLAGAYALTQQYEKSRQILGQLRAISPNHEGAKQLLQRIPPN